MTFQILQPITLTTNDVAFTNATTTSETAWSAGTYASGTKRYLGMILYQVSTNVTNTTNSPPHADWNDIGYIDPYKCFDGKSGTLTSSSGTNTGFTLTVESTQPINGAAFLGIDAETLTVTMTDDIEGEVYSHTESLLEDVENWWQYFFLPYNQKTDVILTDLPNYTGATIEVEVTRTSGKSYLGEAAFGQLRTLGLTQFGASASIQDYSRKTTDADGNYIIETRPYSKRASYDVQLETVNFSLVHKYLSEIRTTPCVFIGDPTQPALIVYGFFRSFNMILSNPVLCSCSIEVEGLA
jgi:hypothetical protein